MRKVFEVLNQKKGWVLLFILFPLWVFLYLDLETISNLIVDKFFGTIESRQFTDSVRFFIFEVPKVLLLLLLIIFIVGVLRTYFPAEKTKKILERKSLLTGNILASLLGVITPFCSCSAIPLFLGFVEAGVPLGVTFSFLIAAPMVNEVAVVLLLGMFGWKITMVYIFMGILIATFSGWLLQRLRLERYVETWVYKIKQENNQEEEEILFQARVASGFDTVKEIVGKIWIYVIIGIAIGAGIHGYVPEDYLGRLLGERNWYEVPLAILLGIPMYSNAAGIIPIVGVLVEKGVSIGTALVFMMSVIALSLPEIIILKKVLKWQLIAIFISIVATGIIFVGLVFNVLV